MTVFWFTTSVNFMTTSANCDSNTGNDALRDVDSFS
jgi:hypothetical protein